MARVFYDGDADLSLVRGSRVAVIGYGSQGRAHTLNLRDSGVEVAGGLPGASQSRIKASADAVRVLAPAAAAEWADVIMILAPDTAQATLFAEEIRPQL